MKYSNPNLYTALLLLLIGMSLSDAMQKQSNEVWSMSTNNMEYGQVPYSSSNPVTTYGITMIGQEILPEISSQLCFYYGRIPPEHLYWTRMHHQTVEISNFPSRSKPGQTLLSKTSGYHYFARRLIESTTEQAYSGEFMHDTWEPVSEDDIANIQKFAESYLPLPTDWPP